MALTPVPSTLYPEQFSSRFFTEYVQENRFNKFMGTNEDAIIQLREDLTKDAGDTVVYELVNRLTGDGVTTDALLGNEEEMHQRSFRLRVNPIRNGVASLYHERRKSVIDLMQAKRAVLKTWMLEKMRNDIIVALGSIDGVPYIANRDSAAATASQKNTWLANNSDRVLFGSVVSNNASNNHANSLLNVDSTADRFTPELVSMMKRRAIKASPSIRPYMTKNTNQEWYVVFAGSNAFRDFKNSGTITQAQREAMERGEDNVLFTGGNLLWDGCIIIEIPQIPVYAGVGASGIDVEPVYLCGAQALGVAWALRTDITVDETDHKWRKSVGIAEIRGIGKMTYGTGANDTDNPKQNGVHTLYVASVPDA